jgi:hypothetical protein
MEPEKQLVAHVNDAIRKLAQANDSLTQIWEFFCECPDVRCRTPVGLTAVEFDERRAASPPVPILAAEHAASAP